MAALEHENLFSILNLAILMQAIVFNFNTAEQEWQKGINTIIFEMIK